MKTMQLLTMGLLCIVVLNSPAEGIIYIDDGGTHTISFAVNDSVYISNGSQVTLIEGGSVSGDVRIEYNAGSFSMSGGSVGQWLIALSSNPVMITGGSIGEHIALDSSSSHGGQAGDVYIYGSDFKINGDPVPYGAYHYNTYKTLTGILANGDPINCTVACAGANDIILIPEPATLTLLVLGVVGLRRKI